MTLGLRTDDLEWRHIDDEIILLDARQGAYLATNGSGTLLWRAIATGATREQLWGRSSTPTGSTRAARQPMWRSSSPSSRLTDCSRNEPPAGPRHAPSLLLGGSRATCCKAGARLRRDVGAAAPSGPPAAGAREEGRRDSASPPPSQLSRAGARATALPRIARGSPGCGHRGAVEPGRFCRSRMARGGGRPCRRAFP